MKKWIILLSLSTLIILSGCSKKDDISSYFEGTYYYYDCIYLNPLSSSTTSVNNFRFKGIQNISIENNDITTFDGTNEKTYLDITVKEVALEQDVEVILSLDVDEIFEQFDTRYDVYSNGTRIGLTIFLHEDIVYFADTSYEGTNNALIIWSIYEVKQEDRFYPNCEQATTQLTLSGVYYTTTTYYCVTEDYDFYYQTTLFLDGPEVVSEQITLLYDETMTYFTKCSAGIKDDICDGTWNKDTTPDVNTRDIFDFKTINLSWFEPIDEETVDDSISSVYDLVSREENREDIYTYFYASDCTNGSGDCPALLDTANLYLKLDENDIVSKLLYLNFPSYDIEFVALERIIALPDEIISYIDEHITE